MVAFFQRIKTLFLKFLLPILVSLILAVAAVIFAQWTEPTAVPPGDNVLAPLNVGPLGQSKEGGLILNTGGAVTGLIVQSGNVGIGLDPNYSLDVLGDIHIGGTDVYRRGSAAGVSASCPAGQVPSGITISGGIVTAVGVCGNF